MLEEETLTKFIHFDQVYSTVIAPGKGRWVHISAGWAVPHYLRRCFFACCCFAVHCNPYAVHHNQPLHVITYIPLPPSVRRMKTTKPHSLERNVRSTLIASCCCCHCCCIYVLWLLVPLLLHRPSWLQRKKRAGTIESAM